MAELGESLSERELDVLRCLAKGAGNKDIAAELFISENTVKVHLRNIFTKLGVSSRTEATAVALQQGVIGMPGVETAVLPTPDDTPPTAHPADPPAIAVVETPSLAHTTAVAQPPAVPTADEPAMPPTAVTKRSGWTIVWASIGGVLLLLTAVYLLPRLLASEPAPTASFSPIPISENWHNLQPLPEPRRNMSLVGLGLNLYAIGGETASGVTDSMLIYHTTNHTWEAAANKPTAVTEASAAVLFGEIFVVGGRLSDGTLTDVVEAYSPTNNLWRQIESLPQPVAGGLALSDGNFLYFFGGWDGEQPLDTAYVYDPASNSWRPLPSMSYARAYLGGGNIKRQFFIVGGYDGQQETAVCEQFNPVDESWSRCPDMLSPRTHAGTVSIINRLYVIGGTNQGEPINFSELYNPDTATWSIVNTPILQAGSWSHLGVTSVETRIFALGGEQQGQLSAENYLYAPLTYQTFIPAASANQ